MKERNFDALLDGVLRKDAGAEPRDGFEARMLAQVGAASGAVSRWWMFAVWAGGLTVAAGMVALILLLPGRHEVRTVPHDGLAASVEGQLPSGAGAPSAGAVYGTRSASLRAGSEAVPLSKTGSQSGGTARRVNKEMTVAAAAHEEVSLPKLETFPSPVVTEEDQATVVALRSPDAAKAMVSLQQEQKEPIRIAAIEIAPLQVTDLEQAQ